MLPEEAQINFNIIADVSSSQRNEVSNITIAIAFRLYCFAEDFSHICRCNATVMGTTATSLMGRRCQVAFSKRDVLRSHFDLLLRPNIISKSTSRHASWGILVPKRNRKSRFCIDCKSLNAVTVKKWYPTPIVEEQLSKLSGNSYFTTLDLRAGKQEMYCIYDSGWTIWV